MVRHPLVLPYMIHISPRLTGLALLPLVALPIVMAFFGQAIHQRTLAIQAQYSDLTSAAHENISGVRIVRAYQQERAEVGQLPQIKRGVRQSQHRASPSRRAPFTRSLPCSGGLGGAAVLYLGGSLVVPDTVTRRRVRRLRGLPRDSGLADDRAGLGGQPGATGRGLDGPAARTLPGAARDRLARKPRPGSRRPAVAAP